MSVKFLMHTLTVGEGEKKTEVPTEFIEVTFAPPAPGSVADVMFRPATDEDRERYRAAYREFKPDAKPAKVAEPEPEAAPKSHGIFKKKG